MRPSHHTFAPASATLLAVLLGGPLSAVHASPSIYQEANFDASYASMCSMGSVGGGNACEYSAVELKRGTGTTPTNGGSGGNAEINARTGTNGTLLEGDLVVNNVTTSGAQLESNALSWQQNSAGTYAVDWRLEGNPDTATAYKLSITVDGSTFVSVAAKQSSFVGLALPSTDQAQQLWIRLRSANSNPGYIDIRHLYDGADHYSFAQGMWRLETAVNIDDGYLMLSDMNFAGNWYLEGSASLDMAGSTAPDIPAIHWSWTESMGAYPPEPLTMVSQVPEPSALLMALAGLGLVAVRRRRVTAAESAVR